MFHQRNGWVTAALTGCLMLVPCASAAAAPTIDNLFTSGGATAGWVNGPDAVGDTDGQALRMSVPSASSYAGADLASLPTSAPATAPSFAFEPSLTGSSAGSPRLVIAFSDGDTIYAMPQTWTAGTWSTVGGGAADWMDTGATSCPALADVTYEQALACHLSDHATVSGVDVIADGRGPFVVYIDDIRYAGATFTAGSAVLAAKATQTALSTARVSRKTGLGTVGASCGVASGRCHFALTLATTSKGKTVAVGRITGSVAAGRAGLLALKLSSTGRKLLAKKTSVSFIVIGTLPGAGAKNRRTLSVKVS